MCIKYIYATLIVLDRIQLLCFSFFYPFIFLITHNVSIEVNSFCCSFSKNDTFISNYLTWNRRNKRENNTGIILKMPKSQANLMKYCHYLHERTFDVAHDHLKDLITSNTMINH